MFAPARFWDVCGPRIERPRAKPGCGMGRGMGDEEWRRDGGKGRRNERGRGRGRGEDGTLACHRQHHLGR